MSNKLLIGMTALERAAYNPGNAIRALVTGDWSKAGLEREISQATSKLFGQATSGFLIPPDYRLLKVDNRAFDVGTATNAGNLVQTSVDIDELGRALVPNMALAQLGCTFIRSDGENFTLPGISTATATSGATETGTVSGSNPTTRSLAFTGHRAFAQVPLTRQSVINIPDLFDKVIMPDARMSLGSQMENLAINGNGAAGIPTGILNMSGLGSVVGGTNGAQINWGHLVDLEAACALLNAEPNMQGGYVVNTKSRQWMKKSQKATNLPFIWGGANPEFPLNDRRAGVTTNVPSNLTKGTSVGVCSPIIYGADWSQFIVAFMGALDVTWDPVTAADKGLIKVNFTQLFDVGIRQPAAFAMMVDALTA